MLYIYNVLSYISNILLNSKIPSILAYFLQKANFCLLGKCCECLNLSDFLLLTTTFDRWLDALIVLDMVKYLEVQCKQVVRQQKVHSRVCPPIFVIIQGNLLVSTKILWRSSVFKGGGCVCGKDRISRNITYNWIWKFIFKNANP